MNIFKAIDRAIARKFYPFAVRLEVRKYIAARGSMDAGQVANHIWRERGDMYKGYGITIDDVRKVVYKVWGSDAR